MKVSRVSVVLLESGDSGCSLRRLLDAARILGTTVDALASEAPKFAGLLAGTRPASVSSPLRKRTSRRKSAKRR